MVVEPGAPSRAQRIAGLQHAAQPPAGAAAHQPEMAAARLSHQFENDAGLAVAPHAEHDAFVGPLHGGYLCTICPSLLLWKLQTHLAIALGVIAPPFAHFNEEEEVHRM